MRAVHVAGGVLFRPHIALFFLPMIAIAAVLILAVDGYDTVTSWQSSDIFANQAGLTEEAQGDPRIVPYLISALAILIAVSAAVVRGIELKRDLRLFGEAVDGPENTSQPEAN